MDGVSSHSTGLPPKGTTDLMMPFGDWFGVILGCFGVLVGSRGVTGG